MSCWTSEFGGAARPIASVILCSLTRETGLLSSSHSKKGTLVKHTEKKDLLQGIKLGMPDQLSNMLPLGHRSMCYFIQEAVHGRKFPVREKIREPIKLLRNK
jgi:hypothetical protein